MRQWLLSLNIIATLALICIWVSPSGYIMIWDFKLNGYVNWYTLWYFSVWVLLAIRISALLLLEQRFYKTHTFVKLSITFFESLFLVVALLQYSDANLANSSITNMFNDVFYCCVFWETNSHCPNKVPCVGDVPFLKHKSINPMFLVSLSSICIGFLN